MSNSPAQRGAGVITATPKELVGRLKVSIVAHIAELIRLGYSVIYFRYPALCLKSELFSYLLLEISIFPTN